MPERRGSRVSLLPCCASASHRHNLSPTPLLADTPGVLASNGAGPGALSFVHVLRRCQGEKVAELVRCRTTWRAGEATSSSSA